MTNDRQVQWIWKQGEAKGDQVRETESQSI